MEIIDNLKQDAEAILNYMASNGLVANAKKTIFMILNLTKRECELGITKSMQVGGEIVPRSTNTKLLGLKNCPVTCEPLGYNDHDPSIFTCLLL